MEICYCPKLEENVSQQEVGISYIQEVRLEISIHPKNSLLLLALHFVQHDY